MMNRPIARLVGLIRSVTLALLASSVAAAASAQPIDPPGRTGRLSDLEGQAWLYTPDSGDWISAPRNQPLTTGDRLATEPRARAEVQVGSTILRLDSDTELEVLALDDDRLELQLHSGSVSIRVRDLANNGSVELATEAGRFVVKRAGSYRFDHADHTSHATVYSGQARYEGANSALPINAGQRAEFWIDTGGVAQYRLTAPVNDDFAAWNGDRDRRVASSVSARYVSPEMTGAEELDRYGRWEQSPEYGALWIPFSVSAGWAPYSHGHWAWVRPWGWTWIDEAPWGFAPFHYGRWVQVRNTWCWTPGAREHRPVYAPALVAWVGGPNLSVSVTVGGAGPSVGWFPLAPREVYVPSYRVSPRYVQNINITHVTNVTQITQVINNPQAPRDFRNQHSPRAITVVPVNVLTDRKPVAPAAAVLRPAPWVRQLEAAPTRTPALVAPPVAAPVAPARGDGSGVRPPPVAGSPSVDRAWTGRPAGSARDRDAGERSNGPRGADRADPPVQRAPAPTTQPAPTAAQPAATPPTPVAPTMRALPVRRPDELPTERRLEDRRLEERRPEERRAPPRPDAAVSPEVRPAQRLERPAVPPAARPVEPTPVPRPTEVQRPAPAQAPSPPAPVRPAEVQRQMPAPVAPPRTVDAPRPAPVAPPAAPAAEVKRPEPHVRPEPPAKDGPEPKRGEPRDVQR